MEMKDGTKFSCSHGEEMLAYLCDELSPDGRERFETHMQGCFECIDEFAELAVSRYSVFEWKSVEFAPMATPKFVIPTETKTAKKAWFDGIRTAFAWNGWALAGGVAAVIVFAVIGVSLWNIPPEATIAGNDPEREIRPAPSFSQVAPSTISNEAQELPEAPPARPVDEPTQGQPASRRVTPQRKQAVTRAGTAPKLPPVTSQTRPSSAGESLQNSPTLGQYVDDQDDSLRLSDIFDDLDTKDME